MIYYSCSWNPFLTNGRVASPLLLESLIHHFLPRRGIVGHRTDLIKHCISANSAVYTRSK